MANFVSEIFSIFIGILSKTAFIAFPILFMSSLLLKINWVHYTGFTATMFLLIFNISLMYGWPYIMFYIIVRGLGGHYVPHGLPPYPYFMTTPQVNHIPYLKTDENGIKELPRIFDSYDEYKDENFQGNFLTNTLSWIFPKSKWKDSYLKEKLESKQTTLELIKPLDCGSYLKYYDLSQPGAK